MKKLSAFFALFLAVASSFAQLIQDDFEHYYSPGSLNRFWMMGDHIAVDTTFARSGKFSLKIERESYAVYRLPNRRLGKLGFSMKSLGPGVWNVHIAVGTGLDFTSKDNWKVIDNFTTEPGVSDFITKTTDINTLDLVFVRLSFEPVGVTGPLYVDDVVLQEISKEAEAIIKQEQQLEELREERAKHFQQMMENTSYSDARRLVKSYEALYLKRVKTLSMLYDKSNMIKIVSGTASTLGDFNQLSNPLRYQKYEQLRRMLFPKLEPIDTLFYSDQVQGKLQSFFKKIENPLNIAIGVGDVFTGGAVSKVVDNFKSLITKGFSTERLTTLVSKKLLDSERKNGLTLYIEAKSFFEDIEEQNQRTLVLNKKIADIYHNSKALNDDVLKLFVDYLAYTKIVANRNVIIEYSKNQQYGQFKAQVEAQFAVVLGKESTFNKDVITDYLKEIDVFIQRIDMQIAAYNELSNQLSSFYADFRTEISRPCPFRNVTETDRLLWDSNVLRIGNTLKDVQGAFNESYTEVNFKQ